MHKMKLKGQLIGQRLQEKRILLFMIHQDQKVIKFRRSITIQIFGKALIHPTTPERIIQAKLAIPIIINTKITIILRDIKVLEVVNIILIIILVLIIKICLQLEIIIIILIVPI